MRLAGFDYAEHGAYFITICTQGRATLFGRSAGSTMRLNDAGRIVERWWAELPARFPHVDIDEFVVMPNHVHGLLFIVESDAPDSAIAERFGKGGHTGPPLQATDAPLSRVVQWFKTMTTNAYLAGVHDHGCPRVSGKLWQRGYYDHIVRQEEALNDIRQYIIDNPRKWGG